MGNALKRPINTCARFSWRRVSYWLLVFCGLWGGSGLLSADVSAQVSNKNPVVLEDGDTNNALPLVGPWQVIRGRLVRPDEFTAAFKGDVTTLPDRWHDREENPVNSDWPAGFGAASYRLKFALPADEAQQALKVQTPYSSYELWVNGSMVAESGLVTETPENFQAFYLERIVPLPNKGEVEIVLLVSNFEHFAGGILRPPILAEREQLEQEARAYDLSYLFVLGALSALLVFHLAYFVRSFSSKAEWSHFWYCILLVVLIVRLATLTTMPFKLFPNFPHFSTKTIEYLSLFFSAAVYLTFLASMFPVEFPVFIRRVVYTLSLPFIISVIFFPVSVFTQLQDAFILFGLAALLYSQGAVLLAWRRNREGAGAVLVFTALFLFTAVNDSLLYLHSVNVRPSSFPDLMPFGFLLLSVGYAIALSAQSRAVYDRAQLLTNQLRQLNKTLDERVVARTEEANAAKLVAEKSATEKANFISAASHDLRQPVHALNLFNQTLQYQTDNNPELRAIAMKQQNLIGSLSEMLETMLDASQLEAETLAIAMQDVQLSSVFDAVKTALQMTALQNDVTLRIMPTSLSVYADPKHIKRVITNLVVNAIKASPSGRVLLGARPMGEAVAIEIWDNGVGIGAEDQNLVFDRYVQLSQKKSSGPAGLGLGLSIVADLCQLMDMPIELRSQPNKGTHFRIIATRSQELGVAKPQPGLGCDPLAPMKRLVLLVVEDNDESLEAMIKMFRQWGHAARGVASYSEALETLDDLGTPDLLITDYRLDEDVTGLDLYAAVLALCPGLPILIVTGATAPEDLKVLTASGVKVLHKPLDPAEMRSFLKQIITPN